jgi:hypothetical protein
VIAAANLAQHASLDSVAPASCLPFGIPDQRVHPKCYLYFFAAKTTSMFSTKYRLFFRPFSAPILCCQQFPSSFYQNRGVGSSMLPKYAAPKKMRKSSNAVYSLFATERGLHHGAAPSCHRSGRRLWWLERRAKTQACARRGRGITTVTSRGQQTPLCDYRLKQKNCGPQFFYLPGTRPVIVRVKWIASPRPNSLLRYLE